MEYWVEERERIIYSLIIIVNCIMQIDAYNKLFLKLNDVYKNAKNNIEYVKNV